MSNADFEFQTMPSGVPNLDVVLGGGIPVGSFNLIAGPPGAGKTILSQQMMFLNATPEQQVLHFTVLGEPVAKLLHYQRRFSFFDAAKINTAIRFIDIGDVIRRPVDLTVEEVLHVLDEAVERTGAKRVVINSISGFELALAPLEREDFREALYRLNCSLVGRRIGVLMTTEVPEAFGELQFTFHNISFLVDNLLLLRYVEIESHLTMALTVVKMRTSGHSRALREYAITERGITLGESTAAQVAADCRLERQLVEGLLESLSRRHYVAKIVEPEWVTYHAVLPELRGRRRPGR